MRTLSLAHSRADHGFAQSLAEFLEFGCDIRCFADDPGEDLLAKAEEGMSADVLALVLSPDSCPSRWARDRWEPILFDQTREAGIELVSILLSDCPFPALLRRRNFFDATVDRQGAMRSIKRWLWLKDAPSGFSGDLEPLYAKLADRCGTMECAGADAERFAREAAHDFAAVLWIPCHRRTAAQIAGELGSQLGLRLEGTAKENWEKIQACLSTRRCLVVLDAPDPGAKALLTLGGRTSTLCTTQPVQTLVTEESHGAARKLVVDGRYAEAYDLYYRLLDNWDDTETCARELSWICERWDRVEEANHLRMQYGPAQAQQLALF